MKALDLFLPRLMPWVSSCPEPLAKQALVDAAIEFCEETHLVKVTSGPQNSVAGTCNYALTMPADQNCASVQKAWYGTAPLDPAPEAEIENILAYVNGVGSTPRAQGTPRWFYEIAPNTIGLYPVPQASEPLMISARVATKPTRNATSLDDALFDDWIEAVCFGARQRLHAMPDQMFSSDTKASQAEARFRFFIHRAKAVSIRGRVSGSLSIRLNRF